MGNTLQEIENVAGEFGPLLLPVIDEVASANPALALPIGILDKLLPMIFSAIKKTGSVQAVANHLDPNKPADPRLSGG